MKMLTGYHLGCNTQQNTIENDQHKVTSYLCQIHTHDVHMSNMYTAMYNVHTCALGRHLQ